MIERLCKDCHGQMVAYRTTDNRCPSCLVARQMGKTPKPRKAIPSKGREARRYEVFRDKVAIPYLTKRYGYVCAYKGCSENKHLDVDHIQKRGSHPELKYDVKNLRFLCRQHHISETDRLHWRKKGDE